MTTIYKYSVPFEGVVGSIKLPIDAKIVDFNFQYHEPFIWAEVDTQLITEDRQFIVYGTGHMIDEKAKYIATAHNAGFVWHLYEISNQDVQD